MVAEPEDDGPELFAHIASPRKRLFLQSLVMTGGNASKAAELVGMDPSTQYKSGWLNDKEYQAAREIAVQMGHEVLESELIRRACEGVLEPVGFHQGKHGGTWIRRYSDTLLMFRLKAVLPHKYGDRVSLASEDADALVSKIQAAMREMDQKTGGGDA